MTWELRRLLQPLVFLNDQMNAVLAEYMSEKIPSKFVFSIAETTQASFGEGLLYHPNSRYKYGSNS